MTTDTFKSKAWKTVLFLGDWIATVLILGIVIATVPPMLRNAIQQPAPRELITTFHAVPMTINGQKQFCLAYTQPRIADYVPPDTLCDVNEAVVDKKAAEENRIREAEYHNSFKLWTN